jgi:hypothetical protein
MMVNAVVVLVCTTLLTAWTHRLGQLVSMAVALFLYVAGYSIYAFCSSFSLFLAATCIWTLGEILMATNSNVFLNAYANERIRSQCNAWMHVFQAWDIVGPPWGVWCCWPRLPPAVVACLRNLLSAWVRLYCTK